MEITKSTDTQVFYSQYDIDYDVRGNGEAVHKADRYKLNIYFDPIKRGSDISAQMTEIEMQKAALQDMLDNRLPLDDDNTVKRLYRWFNIEYDRNTRIISSFSLNEKKVAMARRTSGFYAIATLGMDLTAMQTWDLYGLRDEQEKYFQQMKSQLGFNRQRNWSEEGKTGMTKGGGRDDEVYWPWSSKQSFAAGCKPFGNVCSAELDIDGIQPVPVSKQYYDALAELL